MRETQKPYRLVIVAPTCFYYQVPLFKSLAAHPRLDLTVYFCSDEGIYGNDVRKSYNTDGNWGVESELLEGYKAKLIHNHSPFPSYLVSLIGLMNFGIWKEIKKERPDVVVVMSWMNPTWWISVLACIHFRIPFLYMTDANVAAEQPKPKWKILFKRLLLGKLLYNFATGFLCAGTANRELYSYYGVPEKKLVRFAYSWGYQALLESSKELKPVKSQLKAELGLPEDSVVVLFCGRLSDEKRPLDLLKAYEMLDISNKALVVVGDGHLKEALEGYTRERDLKSVHFAGFQDRNSISRYYALADVLVLPSIRETWGIVVSEALCFGLPAIISHQVGAGLDLVQQDQNGFKFPAGDVNALADCLKRFMALSDAEREAMGLVSTKYMEDWSSRDLADTLTKYLDSVCPVPK